MNDLAAGGSMTTTTETTGWIVLSRAGGVERWGKRLDVDHVGHVERTAGQTAAEWRIDRDGYAVRWGDALDITAATEAVERAYRALRSSTTTEKDPVPTRTRDEIAADIEANEDDPDTYSTFENDELTAELAAELIAGPADPPGRRFFQCVDGTILDGAAVVAITSAVMQSSGRGIRWQVLVHLAGSDPDADDGARPLVVTGDRDHTARVARNLAITLAVGPAGLYVLEGSTWILATHDDEWGTE